MLENVDNRYDLIVLGDGIAARAFLYNLAKEESAKKLRILQVFSDQMFPACSLRTTAVVSCGMHERGISKLGDLLVEGLEGFESIFKQSMAGIYPTTQYYIPPTDERKLTNFMSRHDSINAKVFGINCSSKMAYYIKPKILLDELKSHYQSLNIEYLNSSVTEVKEVDGLVEISSGAQVYRTRRAVLCGSSFTHLIYQEPSLPQGKAVSGSYGLWTDQELGDESFIITQGHFNIIYRHEYRELLFGGTSTEGHILAADFEGLRKAYEPFVELLSIRLPVLEEARLLTGIRHKGKKRLPFFGPVTANIFAINGLYKNGFSIGFHAGKVVAKEILNTFN